MGRWQKVGDTGPVVGDVLFVELQADGRRRRQAIVLHDEDGCLRAYLNLCRHLPIPLDGLRGEALSQDGTVLECRTHGARYRRSDGLCVEGPCAGASLYALRVRVDDAGIHLEDDGPDLAKRQTQT